MLKKYYSNDYVWIIQLKIVWAWFKSSSYNVCKGIFYWGRFKEWWATRCL